LFDDSDPVVGINYPITDVEITVAIDAHNENGPARDSLYSTSGGRPQTIYLNGDHMFSISYKACRRSSLRTRRRVLLSCTKRRGSNRFIIRPE
jgi:hypothetical protein